MKRILDCEKNDQVINIRTLEKFIITNVNPFMITDEVGTSKIIKVGTFKRWYKYVKTLSSSEVASATGCGNQEVAVTVAPPVVEVLGSRPLTMLEVKTLAESKGCEIKENKSHTVIRRNNKNIIEVHPTKKHINLIFRDTILSDDEKTELAENYKGKIANVTWVLNYKIVATQTDIFERILNLAIAKA